MTFLAIYSFLQRGLYGGIEWSFNFQNYLRVVDTLYFTIIGNSLWLAVQTTLYCLAFGIPLALVIALSSPKIKNFLLLLIVLPFLSNFLIRTYSLKYLLREEGLIAQFFQFLGLLPHGESLSTGVIAVSLGMVINYLPLMVLPLYVSFEKFDYSLIEAGKDLGANSLQVFIKIFLPNVKNSILSGCIMVFVPCIGEFIIPDILGGAHTNTLGKLISEQFLKTRDWPFGAALAICMLIILFIPSLFLKNKRGDL
jgi:spermidine/putrescine transport system permease protein